MGKGLAVVDVCRKLGINEQTYYRQRILPIPPAPAVFHQHVIDVGAIGQEHIGKGAPAPGRELDSPKRLGQNSTRTASPSRNDRSVELLSGGQSEEFHTIFTRTPWAISLVLISLYAVQYQEVGIDITIPEDAFSMEETHGMALAR